MAEAPADLSPGKFAAAFKTLAENLKMRWELHDLRAQAQVALLASKTAHCLYELMLKQADGLLPCEFSLRIGNHPDLESAARRVDLPFHYVSMDQGQDSNEKKVQEILEASRTEIVVLARYMRVLSPGFTARWKERLLNIHHGFPPAFQGAKPYAQAQDKGRRRSSAPRPTCRRPKSWTPGPVIGQDVIRHLGPQLRPRRGGSGQRRGAKE